MDATDPRYLVQALFTSPSLIRSALACGGLSVTGRVRTDDTAAIKLTGTRRLTSLPLTVYVSPATYRLVEIVVGGLRKDYRWLAPTAANLAMLTVRVPAGFRRLENPGPPFS